MRGQLSFDLIVGMVMLASFLTLLGTVIDLQMGYAKDSYRRVVCEYLLSNISNYYSFLRSSGVPVPNTHTGNTDIAEVNVYYSGGRVYATIEAAGMRMACEPREVRP